MTNFNDIKIGTIELVEFLELIVSIPVWAVIEPRIREFADTVNAVRSVYINTDNLEDARNEIIEHIGALEGFVSGLTLDDINDPSVDQLTLDDAINDTLDEIKEKIRHNLPSSSDKAVRLADLIEFYLYNYNDNVRVTTSSKLRHIANDWYDERGRERDLSDEEADALFALAVNFADEVDRDLEKILKGSNKVRDVYEYMDTYNDRLFDLLSGRDPNSTKRRDLHSLSDPVVKLLVMMRYRDGVVAGLVDVKDLPVYSTGVDIHDLIRNFDTIEINEDMKKGLEVILNK